MQFWRNFQDELVSKLVEPLQSLKKEMREFMSSGTVQFSPSVLNYAEQFSKNVDRTLQIISLLEQTGKLRNNRMILENENCNSESLLNEALESVQEFLDLRQIKIEKSSVSISFLGDKTKLVQVLTNLLSNAIKFSPKKSTMTLCIMEEKDSRIKFSVTDAGPGLTAEEQSKIFERFVQGNSPQKDSGYGLGLAISKMIVEAHGGEIGVYSQENHGSTFWFAVPIEPCPEGAPQEVRQEAPQEAVPATIMRQSLWGTEDAFILAIFFCLFVIILFSNALMDMNAKKLETTLLAQKKPEVRITDEGAESRILLKNLSARFYDTSSPIDRKEVLGRIDELIANSEKPEIKFACYVTKADLEMMQCNIQNAIAAQKQAAIYSLANGQETVLTGRCYALMASYYSSMVQTPQFFDLLVRYAQRSLNLLEKSNTPVAPGHFLSYIQTTPPSVEMARFMDCTFLGQAYTSKKDKVSLEKAIKYLLIARDLGQTPSIGWKSAGATTGLAEALWFSGQKRQAIRIVDRLARDVGQNDIKESEAHLLALCAIGDFYRRIGHKQEALEAYERGQNGVEKLDRNKPVLRSLFQKAIESINK